MKNILSDYPEILRDMELVENTILNHIKSRQPLLNKTVEELIYAGGKRLRPLLMILSARMGEYDQKKIIPLAAGIELLHMATLIHDDIIDNAKLRRNIETVQSKWGKDVAVFTGDFLLCKAMFLFSSNSSMQNLNKISRSLQTICEGEIQQYYCRYKTDLSTAAYLKRVAAKTAILFKISALIGAYEAKCNKKVIRALARFSMNMGMAFQITDDILDFTGNKAVMGKPSSNDFTQGIYTLPIIHALEKQQYRKELSKLLSKEQYSSDDIAEIVNITFESGGIHYSKKIAQRYLDKAYINLNALPESDSKKIMKLILDQLLLRKA